MKKYLIGLIVLLVISTGLIYVIIPSKKYTVIPRTTSAAEEAVRRHFINKELWVKWLPTKKTAGQQFTFDNAIFYIRKIQLNGWQVAIQIDKDSIAGALQFNIIDSGKGTEIAWVNTVYNGSQPIQMVQSFVRFKKFETLLNKFMDMVGAFFNSNKNIYGFDVAMERTKDFSLLVLKKQYNHEPGVEESYQLVNEVKQYISAKGATEKSPPMLNIYQDMPGVYEAMVAIPTTKDVEGNGTILFKQLVEGNILVATVTGGVATVKKAERELQQYVYDYKKTAPAMPYQSLVTNRLLEKDTSKWVTKLYFPVFY
jgi:effector-binding domain-containing protein